MGPDDLKRQASADPQDRIDTPSLQKLIEIGSDKNAVDKLLSESSVEAKKEIAIQVLNHMQELEQSCIVFMKPGLKYLLYRLFSESPQLVNCILAGPFKEQLEARGERPIMPSDLLRTFTPKNFEVPHPDIKLPPEQPIEGLPKVLLIGAYEPGQLPMGRYNAPPFGLVRMASFLRNNGVQADIYDVTKNGIGGLQKTLQSTQYDYIGFSVLGSTILHDIDLMHRVRAMAPHAKLLAGGQSATFRPDLMEKSPADYVCLGYGEYPVLNLAYNHGNEGNQKNVPGLMCRNNEKKFDVTKCAESLKEADLAMFSTTYQSNLVPLDPYYEANRQFYATENNIGTVRIFTQTHCPHSCNFCSSRNFLAFAEGRSRRGRESEMPQSSSPLQNRPEALRAYVHDRMLNLSRAVTVELSPRSFVNFILRALQHYPKLKTVFINDDNFLSVHVKHRFREIVELIRATPELREVKFICSTRVDDVDEETIALAKEMGVKEINFGVESFSPQGLKSLAKKVRLRHREASPEEVVKRAVELCTAQGIKVSINLIFFYPEVDLSHLEETITNSVAYKKRYGNQVKFNLATFIRAYFGANIIEEDYPKEYREKLVQTNEGPEIYKAESKLLPVNPRMRDLARLSTEIRSSLEEAWKKDHHWQRLRAPKETIPLFLFKAIYLAAEQLGLQEKGFYRAQIDEIDEMIEEVYRLEVKSPIGTDITFSGELAEYFEGAVVVSSMDKDQLADLQKQLSSLERKGLLQKKYAPLIAKIMNFKKELFNEQWEALGEYRAYFELMFHTYECSRYWHLEPLQQSLAMTFFLLANDIDANDPNIANILGVFGFDINHARDNLIPYLTYYLQNVPQFHLRGIFEKALTFLQGKPGGTS